MKKAKQTTLYQYLQQPNITKDRKKLMVELFKYNHLPKWYREQHKEFYDAKLKILAEEADKSEQTETDNT
jgi:hypothetical protein